MYFAWVDMSSYVNVSAKDFVKDYPNEYYVEDGKIMEYPKIVITLKNREKYTIYCKNHIDKHYETIVDYMENYACYTLDMTNRE